MDELAPDAVNGVEAALRIARELIEAGIPVFAAAPCPAGPFGDGVPCDRPGHGGGGVEYDLPARWQLTVPSPVWLERWQPGWALAAVGGWAADFLDEDPRNGGDASVGELAHAGAWPNTCGVQETKSGGRHYVTGPLRERKVTGLLPGLDYQGGAADGQGRGFIWIAPTVGRSKSDGSLRAYRWIEEPDLSWLTEFGQDPATGSADPSLDGLRLRIAGHRAKRTERVERERERSGSAARQFTPAQMEHFLAGPENALRTAQIGQIEEYANAYACSLSHFVPVMLTAEAAYDRLTGALGGTAYDPAHPASGWEAEKFAAVISDIGGRAPADWHAVVQLDPSVAMAAAVAAVDPQGDAVSALLAEMLPPSLLAERRPPRYMVKGLLTYDSTPWLIGGPGSKKSFVALDLAAHVALGRDWQGHKVNKGIAILIAGEGGGSIGKRIQAWHKEYGPMPDDAIRILPRPVQSKDPAAWAVLVRACERLRAALDPSLGMFVVVDTQARATVGLDENSAEEMGIYVDAVTALKAATQGCVLSVHHTTKAGAITRGSGALDGAQDTRLLMESRPGELTGRLTAKKQKDLEEGEPIELRFHKVDVGLDEDGEAIDSLTLTPRSAWSTGLFDAGSVSELEQEAEREINPFSVRNEPEEWTHRLTRPQALLERWFLQALADVARGHGLSETTLRDLVAEKVRAGGKFSSKKDWVVPFQKITDPAGPAGVAGIVVKVSGAGRWTVDPVALEAFRGEG